ncbi:PIK3C2A [Cordylochernes scorpioides]|uniref:PIK3C2A n=1 Tax=Cordylochernes scorpioides TaxID=51811 RepID=A0ABY6LHD0_9ARAC|nr:PIK3C2A [Cordylochernes scorpioides]
MSVPPLPPRPTNCQRWSDLSWQDSFVLPSQQQGQDSPPPLPPRNLACRSLADDSLLNRVPPAPVVHYGFTFNRTPSFTAPSATPDVLNFMRKKQDSNLIDLFTSYNGVSGEAISNISSPSAEEEVLRLFDPLAPQVEEEPLPPNPVEEQPAASSQWETFDSPNNSCFFTEVPEEEIDSSEGNITEIKVMKKETSEIRTFCEKLKKLRSEFPHNDNSTNTGLVISPTLDNYRQDSLSIQLSINTNFSTKPISFTCDIKTSIEHIISHVVCSLIDNVSDINMDNFVLRVFGFSEYLSGDSQLNDYEYVHHCQKFDKPVHLTLVAISDLQRSLLRTEEDDNQDTKVDPEELLQHQLSKTINCSSLNILLETLTKEIAKTRACLQHNFTAIQPHGVVQALKAICTMLYHLETPKIIASVEILIENCLLIKDYNLNEITSTSFDYVRVNLHQIDENFDAKQFKARLEETLDMLLEAIRDLILVYSHSFKADFYLPTKKLARPKDITTILDTLLIEFGPVLNVPNSWINSYESFEAKLEIYHGQEILASVTHQIKPNFKKSFFQRIEVRQMLQFEALPLCVLPREARLFITLYGFSSQASGDSKPSDSGPSCVELGWCGLQMFNYQHELVQGGYALGLWPTDMSKESGPFLSNFGSYTTFIFVSFNEYGRKIKFPKVMYNEFSSKHKRKFDTLDPVLQSSLKELIENEPLQSLNVDEKELIWSNRHYLYEIPRALPKVLQAAHGWGWACLADIYSLLREWSCLSGGEAIALLSPRFPDIEVRKTAIMWMKSISSDELGNFLPQMVQVLRYEAWDDSSLAWFLLEKSLMNIRIAHQLYWLLLQSQDFPLSKNRMSLVLNALKKIMGHAMRERLEREHVLLNELSYIADKIKTLKDSQQRTAALTSELSSINTLVACNPTSLPLNPSLEVSGVDIGLCTFYNSNTLPLKIVFLSSDKTRFETLYKVGDDLRQDALTLQMIRLMNKLWLKEGLDLKIVTFNCIPTDFKKGFIEMVQEAETLRKIHTENGVAGSFKDRSISEWLMKHNTSELEYQQAVENFTLSCAGYCVATYILGVCDRHNDNIMIKTSGHIFHIDFGKFLGDSQMFGTFKRDRVPFVLTPDMAYVINGGERYTKKFQNFIDLCCQAFNILRENSFIFLNLFSLMVHSGIPGVSTNAVSYVEKALLPEISEGEAMGQFAKMIQESLKSRFTQFNFFLHNLAQMRFSGDHNDASTLSFVPKTFTKDMDGKISYLEVLGCQKRYDPEKYYVYIIKVCRENVHEPKIISRSYREFLEFNQKMCILFPHLKLPVLSRGSLMGRTNVREVAEKRKAEIGGFLQMLLGQADPVAHCNLVYTFFHPLLRDQEGLAEDQADREAIYSYRRSSTGLNKGQVKLSIVYKKHSLLIMVLHAKNLFSSKDGAPDPYVKLYLLPDPSKTTKKKTKVMTKTNHPTFMEMLVYDIPLSEAQTKVLHASVWNYDRLQENEFLGAIHIPLSEMNLVTEVVQWYPLGDM